MKDKSYASQRVKEKLKKLRETFAGEKLIENGKYGEEIWEKKIKYQKEIGVIAGNAGSIKLIKENTQELMNLFDKEIRPLLKKDSKILDLGVGPMARFSIEFAKRGYKVIGIDISDTTLNYANKYIKQNNVKVNLKKGDITEIDNLSEKFDFIFCAATFYHIPIHLTGISLMKIKELLRKNGRFFVEFGVAREKSLKENIWGLIYLGGHYAKRLLRRSFNVNCSEFTNREIKEMVEKSGFEIEKKFREDRFLLKIKY